VSIRTTNITIQTLRLNCIKQWDLGESGAAATAVEKLTRRAGQTEATRGRDHGRTATAAATAHLRQSPRAWDLATESSGVGLAAGVERPSASRLSGVGQWGEAVRRPPARRRHVGRGTWPPAALRCLSHARVKSREGREMVASRAGTWAMPFESGSQHGLLARPEVRHDTKYFGPCLGSRHGGLHGLAHIMGCAWASMARK
jgi:hypothetical protein